MAIYAIGDVQGCYAELIELIEKIRFDTQRDVLWFVGDLVNRGPASLEVLRYVRSLGDRATVVLGNHDLHLITLALGHTQPRGDDTLGEILRAPDRDEIIDWLRQRPMLHTATVNVENQFPGNVSASSATPFVLVHAGLLPSWSVDEAAVLAREVENAMLGPRHQTFFAHLYGSKPTHWNDSLTGADRIRVIVNAMTRMRFCSAEGEMEFQTKGETAAAPPGFMPWFDVPGRKSAQATLVCGHWSALGLKLMPNLVALDTGCVWGGKLSAIRLEDRTLFQVASHAPATQWH